MADKHRIRERQRQIGREMLWPPAQLPDDIPEDEDDEPEEQETCEDE